jgi:hypothetical protein
MKRFLMFAVATAALLALALPAPAQTKGAGKASPAAARAGDAKKGDAPVKEKSFDFEGDVVEAQFLRPDQGVAEVIRLDEGPSLIKVRTDFVDEILKSAEDL